MFNKRNGTLYTEVTSDLILRVYEHKNKIYEGFTKKYSVDKLGYYEVYDNIEDFYSKNEGTFYYLTRYGHSPHTTFDYSNTSENIYFIFGKESTGIPPSILKPYIDKCMRIPMTKNVRSLNLSNTVAIVVYEALRQQNYNDLLFEEPHKSKDFIIED